MTRALLDMGGLCFGTTAFLPSSQFRRELIAIGCGLFGFAAVLDLIAWVVFGEGTMI